MSTDLNDISPELREKAKACTSPEELLALAKHEGYKLSEEELVAVAGGGNWSLGSTADCDAYCSEYSKTCGGDAREDIDPDLAHADFVNGSVDGGEFE